MVEIKLMELLLEHFKGCERLKLELNGRSAAIYGDNATGKTTIYDGLLWLLFGKDSRGRKDFEIKPLGADGAVLDHGAVTAVECLLEVSGLPVRLRKTYFERWSTKRGCANATYDGNTSEFFVDGVPMQKKAYEARVAELVDEELFRGLTSVTWFCEGLDWKSRRAALLEISGAPDDKAIMALEPEFMPLAEACGTLSLEDCKKKALASRKSLNSARNTIPARLDEQNKLIQELSGIDFPSLQEKRDGAEAEALRLTAELARLDNGALVGQRRNELGGVKNELARLEAENEAWRKNQMVFAKDERPKLQEELRRAQTLWRSARDREEQENRLIARMEEEIQRHREEWNAQDRREFSPSVCPTCGRALDEEAQQAAKRAFEQDVAIRKAMTVQGADMAKLNLADALERREGCIADAVAAENEIARLTDEINGYEAPEQPVVTDLPEFARKAQGLRDQAERLAAEIGAMEADSRQAAGQLRRQAEEQNRIKADLDQELAKQSMLALAEQRRSKLMEDAKKAAAELEAVDKLLFLMDEFTRYKVRLIEDSINGCFQLARWKLFDQQVNGALADCCEAAYDGVPYGSLNNGMRINLGVDVIRTLSRHYGLRVPLIIDNAESVTRLEDAETQVIRLVVSQSDRKLRCENA